MDHLDLLKKLDSTQRYERLMPSTQACPQLVLVSIYSFVRLFGIHSFRRDDITVANKVDVLKKHRVRKLQDHLTFFCFFVFSATKMSEKIAYWP